MKDLIIELKSKNINLSVDKDELVLDFDGNHLSEDLISKIKVNKSLLIEYLKKYENKVDYFEIPIVPLSENYHVSSGQLRIWMLSHFENGSAAYNMPTCIVLEKNIDIPNFKRAINSTIERHESLRTIFKLDVNGNLRQWVLTAKDLNFDFDYKDFRNKKNKEELVNDYVTKDCFKSFDIEKGPLLRAALLQTQDFEYVFYYNLHHIISDGWSMDVLSKDVLAFYESFSKNSVFNRPQLSIQYKDYAAWQTAQLATEAFKKHNEYWINCLKGDLPVLDLPSSRVRPKIQTFNGLSLTTFIGSETTLLFKKFISDQGGTLFMGLVAAWDILLYKYTGCKDLILGTPVAGRTHSDLTDQIGFYVNTLILRNEVNPEKSFIEFYDIVKDNILLAFEHQAYPFDKVLEEINTIRDTSRNAVFDIMFSFQNFEENSGQIENNSTQIINREYCVAKFDLNVIIREFKDGLSVDLTFNTDVYEEVMIVRLMSHFKQLIDVLLSDPNKKIKNVDYLAEHEKIQLVDTFNNTTVAYPNDKTIIELFHQQVKNTPNHIAIICNAIKLSYHELNECANRFSNYLRETYLINSENLVCIKLEKNENLIVSILGILKAGGAYVPIDPDYPLERQRYIQENCNCKIVIDETEFNKFKLSQSKYQNTAPSSSISASNLAYVMYTSGTSGVPKGVMVEHKNVVRLVQPNLFFPLTEKSVLLSTGSVSFDATIIEFFGTLLKGATLVLVEQRYLLDVDKLIEVVDENKINCMWMTASWFKYVVDNRINIFKFIQHLIVGGDVVSPAHVKKVFDLYPTIKITNGYGPTENTTFSTTYAIQNKNYLTVPIGKPISNSQVYIFDEDLNLVPIGVDGVLYVSGHGLSRGYINNSELSSNLFVPHPYKEGERMYKTGDIGRWLMDGTIEYVGRKDEQVKIRGYRIELGEIENKLLSHPLVISSVVIIKESPGHEKEIVAYVVASEKNIDLRGYLKEYLPDYMLPVHIIEIDEMPLTSNGKLDKRALPNPSSVAVSNYVAPTTAFETAVNEIWKEVLQREQISIHSDFFELGGHSLKALRLINQYHKHFHVKPELKELFIHSSFLSHCQLLSQGVENHHQTIERVSPSDSYILSDAQRRIWVLSQFEGGSQSYNMPFWIRLEKSIDVEKFQKAIYSVVSRHESLRTIFKTDNNGQPWQYILTPETLNFSIDYKDYRQSTNKEEALTHYINQDNQKAFDLEKGPLIRVALLELNQDEYVLYYNMHHIISDGWSLEILYKDTLAYYQAYINNQQATLPELSIQYKDYAAWQQSQLESPAYALHRSYWIDYLKGTLPVLDLPIAKQRPKIQSHQGQNISTYLDATLTLRLKEFVNKQGGTLFISLLASWNALLHRYTGQTDIIIGSPVAGRDHADLNNQIGFYVNTLALRNQVDDHQSFEELYQAVKERTLSSYTHQAYPFDRLVEDLVVSRDTSRNAVFDIMLSLQNVSENISGIELSEEQITAIKHTGGDSSKFDLDITFEETGPYLALYLSYDAGLYEAADIEQLIKHYKQLLNGMLTQPHTAIGNVEFISAEEKQQILEDFNANELSYDTQKTILDIFEQQVANTPDKIAVVFNDHQISYNQLNQNANQFANYLKEKYDPQPENLIGIKLERSEWMIISFLGVLKTGAAYVPIDPEYPEERISFIELDSRMDVCIDSFLISDFLAKQNNYSKTNLQKINQPHDLAYVIYTSGTTGNPKGVMVEHCSIVNAFEGWKKEYQLNSFDVNLLQLASMSFDVFVGDVCRSILTGGKMIICPNEIKVNAEDLFQLMNRHKVSILEGTPSLLLQVMEYFNTENKDYTFLKLLIFGSDSINNQDYIELQKKVGSGIKIVNSYGVTEATIDSTFYCDINKTLKGYTPIGKPFPNTSIYIVNEYNNIVPVGIVGEICIGGFGLARGYLNRRELTNEKFVTNPYKANERIYKTGDIGRWLPDGNIDYIGRKDDQVKIRGYRIELAEIEAKLQQKDGISTSVVIAKKNEENVKELVAYIVSEKEETALEVRAYLRERLPEYMVPAYFVQLQSLPITPNGKIDKKALPDPENFSLPSGVEYIAYVPPTTDVEVKLVDIWKTILTIEKIGVHDNFFALGGHSLKMMRLINEYYKNFNVKVGLKDLFINSTIKSHSNIIKSSKKTIYKDVDNVELSDSYSLSDGQRRLWVISQFEGASQSYNMPFSIVLEQKINIDNFKQAIFATIDRHESLRTIFRLDKFGEPRQFIIPKEDVNFVITCEDFRSIKNKYKAINEYIIADNAIAFNLHDGPLLRAALLQTENNEHIFYYNMHHIISDGWSMSVLSKDVLSYYNAYNNKITPDLSELRIQYKDYSAWQQAQLNTEEYKNHKKYWVDQLSGDLPLLDLQQGKERPKTFSYKGAGLTTYIDKKTTLQLKQFAHEQGGTLFMALLASWNVLLHRYTGQTDIIIGTPIAGREHSDFINQIGFYVNTLALRTEISSTESFYELYRKTIDNTLQAYEHQTYPFDSLVDDITINRDMSRNAIFDVMLVLQNTEENSGEINLPINDINEIQKDGIGVAKFDITITMEEVDDCLLLNLIFNTDIYEEEIIIQLINNYKRLLQQLLNHPAKNIGEIDYLSQDEKDELIIKFNDNIEEYLPETIMRLFEHQVLNNSNKIAVLFEDKTITYGELNEWTNTLANYLISEHNASAKDKIGVILDRSIESVVCMIAVMKSGACYVPVDRNYPSDRITYILRDSSLNLVLTDKENLSSLYGSERMFINIKKLQLDKFSNKNTPEMNVLEDASFVIYTSGSTGVPKGVVQTHKMMSNLIQWDINHSGIKRGLRHLQYSSFNFDSSLHDIYFSLCGGGSVFIANDTVRYDYELLLGEVISKEIEVLSFPFSAMNNFFDQNEFGKFEGHKIKYVVSTAEQLYVSDKVKKFLEFNPTIELHNHYGPSETHVVTSHNMSFEKNNIKTRSSIGKPVSNTCIYILNEHMSIVPVGVLGEVYIGGANLAIGYLNLYELTNSRFIADPFKQDNLVYKTGDLAYWKNNGEIEYVGRKDDQVKIRGYRVELGEIESKLLEKEDVSNAVVIMKENTLAEKELVAYIVADKEQSVTDLRAYLNKYLPEYMVPSYFVQLNEFPLTSNGKINKKILPDPAELGLSNKNNEFVAPRNESEFKLVQIWSDILGIDENEIGVKDNFFALGGHSLKVIRLINKINKEFNVKYDLKGLYNESTIELIAEKLRVDAWLKDEAFDNENYDEVKI